MSAPENPAAFPRPIDQVGTKHVGMELRDWFAGQALAGICSNQDWLNNVNQRVPDLTAGAAAAVYDLADAMLAERERSARS